MSEWFLGTIGFSYKDWVGEFYPKHTSQRDYLAYYSKNFNCVEIDSTFHAIPKPSIVQSWFNITPNEFIFCLKTPRIITHEIGLKASIGLMSEFLDSIKPLEHKTGPILIQLPPSYTQARISDLQIFIESLPVNFQYAIEFRHPSWYNDKTTLLLRKYHICWVTIDYPNIPKDIRLSTDFIYMRWIGINGMYRGHSFERVEKRSELMSWFEMINSNQESVQRIYGFFNNDYTGFAAGTCKRFLQLSGITQDDQSTPYQKRLF